MSNMLVHIPPNNPLHKYFVFVSEEIDLTKHGIDSYDGRNIQFEYQKSLAAGVYGFRSHEIRDRFMSMVNGGSERERAFIAKFA